MAPPGAKSVAIIMGSQSDWQTMKHAAETLDALGVSYDARIVSAHRTPERLYAFAKGAKAAGFKVIIAGAGGAAHLPGMTAALTSLPVFGVPIESKALSGPGFALFHRADAAGRSGRHVGDRTSRRRQCRAARGERFGAERSGAGRPARSLAAAPDRRRRGRAQGSQARERCRACARARGHDRHPRRRPARAHAGAGGGAARLQVPYLRA